MYSLGVLYYVVAFQIYLSCVGMAALARQKRTEKSDSSGSGQRASPAKRAWYTVYEA